MRLTHSETAPNAPPVGASIGERYRVESALGRGGAARLYRVVDLTHHRTLALKLLRADAHPKLRELFELEYQTLASLDHPRMPRAFDFGSDARGLFYTMELLEGADLGASAPLPWRAVAEHLRDASQALCLLHARKLIHRDVSPRNLWRTPDGRVKLIDFGALAPFGSQAQVIGTPPLVPPEALTTGALDQRADLYTLGAVAYFLLTGRHAFPARVFQELPELWRSAPAPPSQHVAQLTGTPLPPVPQELDALVLALLSGNALMRPGSTAEVIDRLDGLCGTPRESEREVALARIRNTEYVKRPRAASRLARRMALAAGGRGQACMIESAPGGGRSRMLAELDFSARTSHASVLHVDAAGQDGVNGVASALALALLEALPERAKSAAEPFAPWLAHLSARVRELLGVVPAPLPEVPGELRVGVQAAQRDWFLRMAQERPLVVLIDSLEAADDASVAFLLALALALARSKLLLVCTLVRDPACERSTAVRALVKAMHGVPIAPLSAAEMNTLLQSVFGAAEHLSRLCGRLFELSRGNPGHALALCQQLVDQRAIAFDSGTWVLPRELDVRGLSTSRTQALTARLSRITGPARELACLLSLHSGALSPGLCRALATSQGSDLLPHLGELLDAEILVSRGPRLLFSHEALRQACAAELASAAAQRARCALAEQLASAADSDVVDRLQAALHWMTAGDPRGPGLVVQATSQLLRHDVDKLATVGPTLEAALALFRARGGSSYEQVTLLTALAVAGYEGERRFVLQYGPEAVHALETLLALPEARRWSRFLGDKLGLGAALGFAAFGLWRRRKDPCVPSFPDALNMFFNAIASSAGACSICFDADGARRLSEVVQPFGALGPNHAAGFMYEFCQAIALSARDHHAATLTRWEALLKRVDQWTSFGDITEAQLRRCRGGILFGMAAIETLRDGDGARLMAEALDQNGMQLDRVYADQIRLVYYGTRGNVREYERYRQRAEHHAIARGTTWQIETWLPGSASVIAMSLHDALAMKSASEQMRRMSEHTPSLVVHARHLRGAYLLLRGKHAEAVPWLEDCLQEAPGSRMAWGRAHGVLARAYNRLGEHARAEAACGRVFEHYTETDFAYTSLNFIVQTEQVLAEAGLGRAAAARERLLRLHAQHGASDNPLLRGQLHETGLELALQAADRQDAREQLTHIERLYRPLDIPSLEQHCERLTARVEQLEGNLPRTQLPSRAAANELTAADTTGATNETRAQLSLAHYTARALRRLAASAHAKGGALYLIDAGLSTPRLAAVLSADQPSPLVQRWVAERLALELDDVRTVFAAEVGETTAPWDVMQEGDLTHRMLVLAAGEHGVIGIAVLSRVGDAPSSCPATLQRTISDELYEVLYEQDRSECSPGMLAGRSQ